MKPWLVTPIAILIFSTRLMSQDALRPMQLAPVQIDDVSDQPATEPLSLLDDFPGMIEQGSGTETLPNPIDQRAAVTATQLFRLNKPLTQIDFSGLASTPDVSRSGFTASPSRLITAGDIGPSERLGNVTTYTRRRLYFEDAPLERCGRSDLILSDGMMTNLHSGAKFLVDTALLPYRLLRQRPDELVRVVAE